MHGHQELALRLGRGLRHASGVDTLFHVKILTNRTFEDYHDAIGDDIVLECTVIHTLMVFVKVKAGGVEREHDVRLAFKSRWNLALSLVP